MNEVPIHQAWRHRRNPITTDKILEWANKWNTFPTPDGNPVPKFVLEENKLSSHIRVEFAGMYVNACTTDQQQCIPPKCEPMHAGLHHTCKSCCNKISDYSSTYSWGLAKVPTQKKSLDMGVRRNKILGVDILEVAILGVHILRVDILGIDILGVDKPYCSPKGDVYTLIASGIVHVL